MERTAWTNERLDDLATGMREGFARIDQDFRDLRGEVNEGFKQLRGEIGGVRGEVNGVRSEVSEVRSEVNDLRGELRGVMYRIGGGIMVGLLGVIAAILVRGT